MAIIGEGPEPISREATVIGALQVALLPDALRHTALNSRRPSATGVCLGDGFISQMEILSALERLGVIDMDQKSIIVLLHGHGFSMREAMRELRLNYRNPDQRNYVARQEAAALQQLVRWLWDEPAYESPPRVRPKRSMLVFEQRLARKPYTRQKVS